MKGGGAVKIRIEIADDAEDIEIIIRCRELTDDVTALQKSISEKSTKAPEIIFYKDKEEYYFSLTNVLFFETDADTVYAHTSAEVYKTDFKLYELGEMLPRQFIRVSKSTIVNTRHILSITKNLASSSLVKFHKSHKQIYVSRLYYKELKSRLSERNERW
jgi:DNA-binding LytR/AlgR family response regulator